MAEAEEAKEPLESSEELEAVKEPLESSEWVAEQPDDTLPD